MIDIENKIVDTIQSAFTSAQKSVKVSSEYVKSPSSFPYVFIRTLSNQTYKNTQDNSPLEHHAKVSMRIEIYSNKTKGAKTEVKELFQIADSAMQGINFTRTSYNFVPNVDYSIVRLSADFSAIVQEGVSDGTNTTFHIYRG